MLKTAKKQNVSSTKIYDLLIGLGADKKKAEFAIGEFVKDIPKILASHTTEKNLDPTVPVSRGDIWRLEAIIKENKNDTDLKLKDLEAVIKENKNDTDIKIAEIKSDLEIKIIESKSVLLQWILGMVASYIIIMIVVLRFFEK